jgi:hypothetical protein
VTSACSLAPPPSSSASPSTTTNANASLSSSSSSTSGLPTYLRVSREPIPAIASPAARRAATLNLVRGQVQGHKDAFYVVDLAELVYKHTEWSSQLPRVRPFYAVKCNDDPAIVATLARLGAGFDCASKGEMSMVLGLGVKPQDIIFAHPAKQVREKRDGSRRRRREWGIARRTRGRCAAGTPPSRAVGCAE